MWHRFGVLIAKASLEASPLNAVAPAAALTAATLLVLLGVRRVRAPVSRELQAAWFSNAISSLAPELRPKSSGSDALHEECVE